MTIKEYIDSGILESYVLGSASQSETRELLQLKAQHPEIEEALYQLEIDMERIAQHMAITPPSDMWERIEDSISELIVTPETAPLQIQEKNFTQNKDSQKEGYIEVEAESSHMRIHKNWKWVFAAVFVLGKIFLACAIYFYLENRQAQQQIQDLKIELKQYKNP